MPIKQKKDYDLEQYKMLKKSMIRAAILCIAVVLEIIFLIYTVDGIKRLIIGDLQNKNRTNNPLEVVSKTDNTDINTCIINDIEKHEQYVVVYSKNKEGEIESVSIARRD